MSIALHTEISQDLAAIIALAAGLYEEAGFRASAKDMPGGRPMEMLAPMGNLEAWGYRLDKAEREHLTVCPLADHRHCRYADHVLDEDPDTLWGPLQLLTFWSEQWRVVHGREIDGRPTLVSEAGFLRTVLDWALNTEPHIDDLAADVHTARVRLEDELRDGERDEHGAPCVHCRRTLVRRCDPRLGLGDDWDCPGCGRRYTPDQYRNAIAAAYAAVAPAKTTADLADELGVARSTIRTWASRGHVRRRGRDLAGRMLFDTADVRHRAEKLAG